MSKSALVEPAFRTHPPFARTLGPEVSDLAELAGLVADPEQRLALDLIFALREDGNAAAFETALIASRQNLKTAVFKMAALGWLFLTDQRLVVWSAHEFRTAQEAFRDMIELCEGSDWLRRRVANIFRGTGDESIEMLSGARLIFKARTKGGGRGLTGDKVVLDEAFALQPMHMGALLPTLSARPDPQVVYGSSAGLPESVVLRSIRDRGRKGDPSLAYLEWTDDLPGECEQPGCTHAAGAVGCRLDDPARWLRANPAMGRRITTEHIAAERRAMPPEEFARERLGWWDAPEEASGPISIIDWRALTDPVSAALDPVVFAFDVTPDRHFAVVVVAGKRSDGLFHLEVIDERAGVAWIPGRLAELKQRWKPASIVADKRTLEALEVEMKASRLKVRAATVAEMVAACAQLQDVIQQKTLRHRGDPSFERALASAATRTLEGGWAWSRRNANGNISSLVAGTLALHELKRPKPRARVVNLQTV